MKKLLVILVMLTFCAALLAGCGTKQSGKVTLRLTTWAGNEEAAELQKILDDINSKNSDFEIIHEPAPDEYTTKLMTTLSGGSGADLMWLSQEWVPNLASKGALLDITDYIKNDSTHSAAKLNDYFPAILQIARYQDKYYGLPWIASPVVLYYNPEMFKLAGIAPPSASWTWQDFLSASAKLTIPGKQWGFTINDNWPPPAIFIWQAGGEIMDTKTNTCPIDSPQAIEGLKYYFGMLGDDKHCVPTSIVKEQGFEKMFKAGKVAMFAGGAADNMSNDDNLDNKLFTPQIAALPKGPVGKNTTFAWSAVTAINSKTANPEIAYKAFIQLTEAIHNWKIIPPRKSLATVDTLAKAPHKTKENAEAIMTILSDMRCYNNIPRQTEWDDLWYKQVLESLRTNLKDVENVVKQARPKLEALLK